MIICVYGSASDKIADNFKRECYALSRELAEKGNSLIYGAGSKGMMGAAARGFKDGGARVHGVIPKFFEEERYEGIFYEADELTFTETMAERKTIMEDGCDAFIITPGGVGTFEEFFEALTLKQLGRHKKAIVIFNIDGYYDEMLKMLENSFTKGFINTECEKLYKVLDSREYIIKYLDDYSTNDVEWNKLKRD